MSSQPSAGASANFAPPFRASGARVIAIGRAGAEIAAALQETGTTGFTYAVVDSDGSAIESTAFPEKLFVGARLTRGFGAGGDPELARTAADEETPAIRGLCQGYPLIFIVAGLGGGSGTGIAPVVARIARETGASVFAFVTAPFDCEGTRRQQQALLGLHRLKTVADGVLCLPNEKLLLLSDDRTTLVDAFRSGREHLRDAVLCIWGLLTRPGLLGVSFADICSVLRGPNQESAFARVMVSGPDRSDRAMAALLNHPLLTHGDTLRRAESLLVSFRAGHDLGMGEIRRIMDELTSKSDGARVVVGAEIRDQADTELTISVMASTRQMVLHEPVENPVADRSSNLLAADNLPARDVESGPARTARRLAPPAPNLTPELADQLLSQSPGGRRSGRKKPQQVPLPFEVVTKGRFEKCEPTVRRGNNLDQPTYLRRGIILN
ncbi:MAG: cell division FtsZ family protein [Verrucomicrobiales bacterium]|nr:cell division FtsZ family protein [Verrucomicrobiales bacterium]